MSIPNRLLLAFILATVFGLMTAAMAFSLIAAHAANAPVPLMALLAALTSLGGFSTVTLPCAFLAEKH